MSNGSPQPHTGHRGPHAILSGVGSSFMIIIRIGTCLLDTECSINYNEDMRKTVIVPNEYYHILNRGNNKQLIFLDERDCVRFLFLLLYFQSNTSLYNLGRFVTHYVRHSVFNITEEVLKDVIRNRTVELVNFTLMSNHFHITVKEIKENGIANYMQRVLNAYTKYFNTKYKKSGHLFQGPYKAVHVSNNRQLLHLSAYIHRNPREIPQWKNREHTYPWSSYQDYVRENRWGKLLEQDIILSQFLNKKEYDDFVRSSTAKELKDNLDDSCFID